MSSPLQYDANGNVTQVQTSTGTRSITYNAENRPVRFENAETQMAVECAYDSQGRFLSRDPIEEQGGLNLYAFVRNMPTTEIDYLGRWLGGMHRQLTYGALSRIRLFIGSISSGRFLLITSRLKDVLIEKIVGANVATDSGDYKNKQNYHYCADRVEGWTTDYAKKFYTETLAQEEKHFLEIIEANQNDKESCLVALEYLGRLCHMWQDYYAHGVEKDDSWFGANIGKVEGPLLKWFKSCKCVCIEM